MGDGIQKKYALIVNGDTEVRHLGNVDRAVKALRGEGGFEISVASTQAPGITVEHFEKADDAGLSQLLSGMGAKMDDDDLLVVYFTGHGGAGDKEEGCVQTPSRCVSLSELSRQLKALTYGNRILVMDNCFSGSGFNLFADAKTTVVSQGSPGETVSCQLFSPFFWGDQIPDADQDGKTSIQERFQFAVTKGQSNSLLQYYSPKPIGFSGEISARPFKTSDGKPVEVKNGTELEAQLQRLKPGQVALVDFGADWCVPCKKYQATFEKLSQQYDGKFLMIHAEGIQGSEEDWSKYGIKQYPTVAFIDWNGKVVPVLNPKDPMESLPMVAVHSKEEQVKIHVRHLSEGDRKEKIQALRSLRELGAAALPALPQILALLKSEDADLRYFSAQVLGEIGPAASSAVPDLIPLLKDRDSGVVTAAVTALGKMGPSASSALLPLLAWYQSDLELFVRREVEAEKSESFQKKDRIFERSRDLQEALTEALVKIAPRNPKLLEAYITALRDPQVDYWRRRGALVGLGLMGGSASEAMPTLVSCLANSTSHVLETKDAIAKISVQSPSALQFLVEKCRDKNDKPLNRYRLIEILNSIGEPASTAAESLEKIARDSSDDPRLRRYAGLCAVKLDPKRRDSLESLLKELEGVPMLFPGENGQTPPEKSPLLQKAGWSWELAAQSNGRTGTAGGGMEASLKYGFGENFGLRFGLNFSGMSVAEGKPPADFQMGGFFEPTFHFSGKDWKGGLYISAIGMGLQYLVGNEKMSGSLAPVGLGYQIPLFQGTSLDLAARPQIHYDGEFQMGGAGRIGISSSF